MLVDSACIDIALTCSIKNKAAPNTNVPTTTLQPSYDKAIFILLIFKFFHKNLFLFINSNLLFSTKNYLLPFYHVQTNSFLTTLINLLSLGVNIGFLTTFIYSPIFFLSKLSNFLIKILKCDSLAFSFYTTFYIKYINLQ